MTLTEVRKKIAAYTADGCCAYITATLHFVLKTDSFEVQQNDYFISDWRSEAAVECWVNGKYEGRP